MKKLFLAIPLIVGFIFATTLNAYALPYPDPTHPPLGPGDSDVEYTTEGSVMVSNTFVVPSEPGGTTISFEYNLITAEFFDEEPMVNDYFAAALLNPLDDYALLEFYPIANIFTLYDSDSFSLLSSPATGPHGSYFTHETGVITDATIVISSDFVGKDVALAFAVFDLDDREVDTAVLIDNIDNGYSMPFFGDFSGGLLGPEGFIGNDIEGDMYGGNVHLLPDGSLSGVDTGFTENEIFDYYAYLSTGPEAMIPEPATVVLLGIGLAGLGGGGYLRRWRRIQ